MFHKRLCVQGEGTLDIVMSAVSADLGFRMRAEAPGAQMGETRVIQGKSMEASARGLSKVTW